MKIIRIDSLKDVILLKNTINTITLLIEDRLNQRTKIASFNSKMMISKIIMQKIFLRQRH